MDCEFDKDGYKEIFNIYYDRNPTVSLDKILIG